MGSVEERSILEQRRKRFFQQQLIRWFSLWGRDLPWRRTQDPYAILVSEVMLQQTQVERVQEYYTRFLDTFPTLQALAEAPWEQVLACWQGLGYYQRARHLHQAAREIVERYGGLFPTTLQELTRLPGVGRYTAGAILSFAFHQEVPILDTNVKRLLQRVFVRRVSRQPARMEKRLWRMARAVILPGKAWIINQAMMDFGATVCTARKPRCAHCCLQTICIAYQRTTTQLPLFAAEYEMAEEEEIEALVAETLERYGQTKTWNHSRGGNDE
ncbi:MAG: A/G-specific adenine glycosylase [Nitrospinota bacterium]|nr:MAG: A/G-specific adenine glycosylase [Nitrospinota bacterium]